MNARRYGMQARVTSSSSSSADYPAPRSGSWFFDDFVDKEAMLTSLNTAGGTHTFAGVVAQGAPGLGVHTVTAVGDGVRIAPNATANLATLLLGGGAIHFEGRVSIPTLSNGVDNIILRIGAGDAASGIVDHTDGVYLEYDFATHGNHNWFLCAASNTTRTKTDTGIAAIAVTFQRWELDLDAAAATLTAKIANAPAALAVTTNIPSTAGRQLTIAMLCTQKQLGAGPLTCQHDYVYFKQTFTTTRV